MMTHQSQFDKGIVSKFEPETFKHVDPVARYVVIQAFKNGGIEVIENPNQFDVDLIVPAQNYFLEVAVKLSRWQDGGPIFPFDSLSIERRKRSYRIDPKTGLLRENVIYIYLSKNLKWGISTRGENLEESYATVKNTTRGNKKENFFHVPLRLCEIRPLGVNISSIPSSIPTPYCMDSNGVRHPG